MKQTFLLISRCPIQDKLFTLRNHWNFDFEMKEDEENGIFGATLQIYECPLCRQIHEIDISSSEKWKDYDEKH